jgi:hypothetical protein
MPSSNPRNHSAPVGFTQLGLASKDRPDAAGQRLQGLAYGTSGAAQSSRQLQGTTRLRSWRSRNRSDRQGALRDVRGRSGSDIAHIANGPLPRAGQGHSQGPSG